MLEITRTYPTPILQDFRTFMDILKKVETVLSPENQYMLRKWLWELNKLVNFKVDDATSKLEQPSYPLLHMFYHLAMAQSEVGKTLRVKDPTAYWLNKLWDWGYFLWFFTYFCFWQFTLDENALKISRREIEPQP